MTNPIRKYITLVESANGIVDVPKTKYFAVITNNDSIEKLHVYATDEIHAKLIIAKKKPGAIINSIRVSTKNNELQTDEGYTVLPNIDTERYTDLSDEGLEGPFRLKNGKVVYYDPRKGRYYDRDTDMYLSNDDYYMYNK